MLKRILILVLMFPLITNLEAQDTFKPSTYIGIHAGTNLSRVSFRPSLVSYIPSARQGLLTSPSFGLILRHVSEPHIGLQLEVNFAGKGWKENLDSIGSYTRNLKTLDIPVMAVFIAGSRTLRLAFTIGPYLSYLRHEKETINIADTLDYHTYYNKPLINNLEFGFTGGLGIELHTKLGAFCIGASYSHSLTNLFPLNVHEYYFYRSRSQALNAGLTYLVKL
jgi:hypothetical protein